MRSGLGFAVLPGGGSQYPAMPLTGGAILAGTPSNFFSYENANQVVWLSRCSFSTQQRPVPRRAASVDPRHPVGDRVPDLVRRIFLDEMDSRHCLLCQCRPPAYKVD